MLLNKLVAALGDHGRKKRERKRAFLENGGLVLEKLVASCNGKPIPICTFSYKELLLATNNFDPRLILERDSYTLYKASFEGRLFSINMYDHPSARDSPLTDMAISAKMSAHKNILKLVGCCLETSIPTLVYEYAQNGVLADRIYISRRQGTPKAWQSRLKIAKQIAHVIAYLHTRFSRPIIHRDIKPENIFLDQHDVPKLTDFSLSISIPEGETHVKVDGVFGTWGFLCPSYINTSRVSENTDVYSFDMFLLHLFTGQDSHGLSKLVFENKEMLGDYLRNRALSEIGDPAILAEKGVGVEQQLQGVRQLCLTFIEDDPEIRSAMVDVDKRRMLHIQAP
jgi:serine/threonine protein kinase